MVKTVNTGSPDDRLKHDDDFHVALLHLAVKEDDILAIKDLTRVTNWIHAADRSGRNSLHWAVAFGSREACELLLSRTGEEGIHHADKIGRTPLHFAAIWGKSNIAKMILARGAEVNALDRKGMTALHYAAQNSNPFLIRSLVKRGADKNARDSRRRISYQVALQWGSPKEILDLLDPDFSKEKPQKAPEMPQAQRFAASLSPKGRPDVVLDPPLGSSSHKDFPAELVKYEMQKQSDKTRDVLRKVVVRRMKKWEPTGSGPKEFALKALAARRRKLFVEHQMKKTQEAKRVQQVKKYRKPVGSSKFSGMLSPLVTRSYSARKVKTQVGTISRPGSKTPTGTKSSRSSSPTALRRTPKGMTPTTFSRPNTPNARMQSNSPKSVRPNPTARHGWPSPPESIRGGKGRRIHPSPLKGKKKRKQVSEVAPPNRKWPVKTPAPARLALSEFVGTSARHNALGKSPSPAIHKCIDVRTLQNQWL